MGVVAWGLGVGVWGSWGEFTVVEVVRHCLDVLAVIRLSQHLQRQCVGDTRFALCLSLFARRTYPLGCKCAACLNHTNQNRNCLMKRKVAMHLQLGLGRPKRVESLVGLAAE